MFKEIKESLKTDKVIIAILVLLIITVTSVYIIKKNNDRIVFSNEPNTFIAKVSSSPSVTPSPVINDDIKIYVVGAVKIPGIVTIKKGQLIEDAVKQAGGFREDADIENINRVFALSENVMLKIKSKKDEKSDDKNNIGTQSIKAAQNREDLQSPGEEQKGYEIIKNSDGAIAQGVNNESSEASKIININTANREQLKTLSGVGDSTADKIIQYREKNGGFKAKEDLKNVSGIGDAKFNAVKDSISVN